MNHLRNVNLGRWIGAGIAAAAVIFVTDFLIHALILGRFYMVHYTFARAEGEMPFWPGIVRVLAVGLLLAWIYTHGVKAGAPGWAQGLRYGFWMGLLVWTFYGLLDYSVLPIPIGYVPAWILAGVVQTMLAGLVIGLVYPPSAASSGE